MKCPKCQYIGFDGHTRCRHCGYDLSLSATTEMTPPAETEMPFDAAPDVPDTIYRPDTSARAQARAAIQKRAASRTPQPESFDLPLFATPGVDDRPALPASRPPLSVRRAADSPRSRAAAAAAFAPEVPEPAASAAAEAIGPAEMVRCRLPMPIRSPVSRQGSRRGSSSTPCRWRRSPSPHPIPILNCR